MAADVSSPEPGPPVVTPPSWWRRCLTSWKLWGVGLVLALAGLGMSALFPLIHRAGAMRYCDAHGRIDYESVEPEWTMNLGSWSAGLRKVQRLMLGPANDATLRCLSLLPEVRELSLDDRGSPMTGEGLDALSRLHDLTHLRLRGENYTEEVLLTILESRPPLKSVVLEHTGADHETLLALSEIPTIEELVIISDTITDEDYRDLNTVPGLMIVLIDGVGDVGSEWLSRSRQVFQVSVRRGSTTAEGIRHLCGLPLLMVLELWDVAHTPESLELLINSGLPCRILDMRDISHLTPDDVANLPTGAPNLPQLLIINADLLTPESVGRIEELSGRPGIIGEVTDPQVLELLGGDADEYFRRGRWEVEHMENVRHRGRNWGLE